MEVKRRRVRQRPIDASQEKPAYIDLGAAVRARYEAQGHGAQQASSSSGIYGEDQEYNRQAVPRRPGGNIVTGYAFSSIPAPELRR